MDGNVPAWVLGVSTAVGLIGGAILTLIVKWRRANVKINSDESKVTLEHKRGVTDLEIHVRDDAVDQWKRYAEEQQRRADDANKRADGKDEEWSKRMTLQATLFRERETLLTKQHQDRELQFQQIVDRLRAECEARLDAIAKKHEDCLRENSEIKGRIFQVEKQQAETQTQLVDAQRKLTEIQGRFEAEDREEARSIRKRHQDPKGRE